MMGAKHCRISGRIHGRRRGFALIVVLTMMVLLTIIALGLLQLSAITLRGSEQERQSSEARANAKVALMLAIGQLQKEMGPDQRISAPAGILDTDPTTSTMEGVANPRFTGVWAAADAVTVTNIDNRPSSRQTGFRSWLVSATDPTQFTYATGTTIKGTPTARTAVGAGSVTDPADQVQVPVVNGPKSGFAWWTSDNGQKATIRANSGEQTTPPQDLATTLASSRRFNPQGYHAMDPTLPGDSDALKKIPDFVTTDVAGGSSGTALPSRHYFHDLTTQSELVPVDVTAGKLRRCLNLYMAWLENQSVADRAAAGTLGTKASAARDFRMFSWDQLRHALSYSTDGSKVTFGSTGRPQITAYKQTGFSGGKDDLELNPDITRDRWRIAPVLLKTFLIVSYSTEKTANLPDPSNPSRTHALRLNVYPVMVLWNPYNVDLVVPEYVTGSTPLPVVFNITAGTQTTKVNWVTRRAAVYSGFGPECPQEKLVNLVIPAGSTRILYPQKFDPANTAYHRNPRFPYDLYLWMQKKNFDCGPGNYGAPFMNLKTGDFDYTLNSQPGYEIAGAPGDPVKIAVDAATPQATGSSASAVYGAYGEHTDWHGNNGTGTDDLNTVLRFCQTTTAGFRFTTGSPQVSVIAPGDIPVRTFGELEGNPTPVMIFECYRKPVDENLFPSKTWASSMPAHAINAIPDPAAADAVTPWYESAYTFRFKAVNSWIEVAQRMQLPPDRDDEAYMGTSYSPAGQLGAIAQEIPLVAPVSLAQLQHLPLFDYRPDIPSQNPFGANIDWSFDAGRVTQFPQNNAIGNSYASPGIPAAAVTAPGWPFDAGYVSQPTPIRLDRSYLANKLLWDGWWCSTLSPQDGPFFSKYGQPRRLYDVANQFLTGVRNLPNEAIQPRLSQPAATVLSSLFDAGGKPKADAYSRFASLVRINGGFNVNSVSVKAWEQLFSQMLSRPAVGMPSVSGTEKPVMLPAHDNAFLTSRFTFQGNEAAEEVQGRDREDRWWNGSRELTPAQITSLAQTTVREVKKRGPFRSLADFVNRGLSADTSISLKGALQAALDDTNSTINQPLAGQTVPAPTGSSTPTFAFPAAAQGALRQGIPGWVTQADLLQVIGPVVSPRSDTFTIRAMGESRDASGKVMSTAWCEAVLQRGADYLSPTDLPETAVTALKDTANKNFGRRFNLVSFRWLSAADTH